MPPAAPMRLSARLHDAICAPSRADAALGATARRRGGALAPSVDRRIMMTGSAISTTHRRSTTRPCNLSPLVPHPDFRFVVPQRPWWARLVARHTLRFVAPQRPWWARLIAPHRLRFVAPQRPWWGAALGA